MPRTVQPCVEESGSQPLSVAGEFTDAELGDRRLEHRLVRIVKRLEVNPALPFPQALGGEADLEGFYRFLRNPECTFDSVLEPHVRATVLRVLLQTEALAIHDSSDFSFKGTREGLGKLKKSGHGFVGHISLAVALDQATRPLGVLAVEAWARTQVTTTRLMKSGKISFKESLAMPKEQERWLRGVQTAEAAIGRKRSLIHVMDSEADDYKLMAALVEAELRWVIRLGCEDRTIISALQEKTTKEVLTKRPIVAEREVVLSSRGRGPGNGRRKRNRPREQRMARLEIRAGQVQFKRPKYLLSQQPVLPINVVMVSESNPPKGEEPIDWILLTTEPIDTEEQVLKIVDIYRARWRVEEFFKALKTGCAFEKRQLESFATLSTALAIFIPIAWNLLRLRAVAREEPSAPASEVLTPEELQVLRLAAKTGLPLDPTAQDALLSVARLGGHLRSNGPPGWQVLGRGYQDLLMLVAGYRLAQQEK